MLILVLGIIYGINKLGGLIWLDEALICRRARLNALAVTSNGMTLITGGERDHVLGRCYRQQTL